MLKKSLLILLVLSVSTIAFGISSDPLGIGVGARPLGMGRAFVSMPGNFFVNPASISDIGGLKLTTMNANVFQNVNYTMVGIANPFSFGSLGIAYVNSGIASIPLTRMAGTTIEVYDSTDYSNSILLASYALPLHILTDRIGFLSGYKFLQDVSAGTNLKIYNQGFSNLTGALDQAKGTGFDMDLGVSYQPDAPFSLGLTLQNALPASMGGKFTWDKNNVEEGIPAVLKVGGAYHLREKTLILAIDSENHISTDKPGVWHLGLEWLPIEMLAIRLGLDQQSSTVQVDNNLTGGIGLKYRGFTFDYAYHQYGDISENTTQYFSIGYVNVPAEEIKVTKPVKPTTIKKVIRFKDVPTGYWAKDAIEHLVSLGIISGYPDGTFKPEKTLSRAELCTLLIKARRTSVKTPRTAVFSDLPPTHWAAPYIKAASDQKLVGGYPDGTFLPNKPLTRAEAIKIIAVFDGLKTVKATQKPFPDVDTTHWAAPFISAAKTGGLLQYLRGKDFEPNRELTRAEAAEILYRTNFVRSRS
jgi:hypothetical protein